MDYFYEYFIINGHNTNSVLVYILLSIIICRSVDIVLIGPVFSTKIILKYLSVPKYTQRGRQTDER